MHLLCRTVLQSLIWRAQSNHLKTAVAIIKFKVHATTTFPLFSQFLLSAYHVSILNGAICAVHGFLRFSFDPQGAAFIEQFR